MQLDSVHQTQYVSMNGAAQPVLSRLSYLAHEPYAVTMSFKAEHGRWVEWLFSRDLLIDGLTAAAGIGDVRLRPDLAEDASVLLIELESPEGYALVEFDSADIHEFVESTLELVPLGEEDRYFDVETLIADITNV